MSEEAAEIHISANRNTPDLKLEQKWAIVAFCMEDYDWDKKKMAYGKKQMAAERFKLGTMTIYRVVNKYVEQVDGGSIYPTLMPKSRASCGITSGRTPEIEEQMTALHFISEGKLTYSEFYRQFLEMFELVVSEVTMYRWCLDIGIKEHRTYLAPSLTDAQKLARLKFIFNLIVHRGHNVYEFVEENRIHVDEKWFYVAPVKERIKTIEGQSPPKRQKVQHKSHIPKLMFISAIGTPRTLPAKNLIPEKHWDGKITVLPFAREAVAKRSSKNRVKGAPVLEIMSVTANEYFDMMVKNGGVISKIKAALPNLKGEKIIIQHDGAKAHSGFDNAAKLNEYAAADGWNMEFVTQPAQSPDLNKNDLAFFYSLQQKAKQLKGDSKSTRDLMNAVLKAYQEYDADQLLRIEALQLEIYRCILRNSGGNDFPMPHSGIRKRQKNGLEVVDRRIHTDLVESARLEILRLEENLL